MEIGIGLPNTVPGTTPGQLAEWAKRAEARGFASLGTIDRLVYDNFEPLTALTAAAAVTERIGLSTAVMLGPLRGNPVALAKQTLSIQALSGGRLTLGIGLGGRDDDYELAGVSMKDRAALIDAQLEALHRVWDDDRVGPKSVTEPPRILVGGGVEASFKRAARFGAGWISAGRSPEEFAESRESVESAWAEAGRDGKPFCGALGYFGLGERGEEDAKRYLGDYYAWLGDDAAQGIAASAANDAETVKGYLAAFEDAGCDELILFPTSSDPDQVDLLADAAGF